MSQIAEKAGAKPTNVSFDIGATNTRGAQGGEQLGRAIHYKTPPGYETAIGSLGQTAREILGDHRPDTVGVSVAGEVRNGRLVRAGQLAENGWVGRPLALDIAEELGVPADRVVLINDCAAGATAQRRALLVRDVMVPVSTEPPLILQGDEAAAFVTLSTGLGGAWYRENEIGPDEPGHRKLRKGAICGCGGDGCVEAHVSGSGILKKFGIRGEHIPHDDPRWDVIKADFHDGMALMVDSLIEAGTRIRHMGFVGSVAHGGPDMLGGLQRDFDSRYGRRAPRITTAVYGDPSGLYGAYFAADEVLRKGSEAVVFTGRNQ